MNIEGTKQLTKEQAIALFDSKAWEAWDNEQIASFQIFQERACLPFARFQEALESVLGRQVYTHEFGMGVDKLKEEYIKKVKAPR